jgi:predicted metalloprotease with PDZ domain
MRRKNALQGFEAGSHSTPKPYSFDDVAAALDQVTPYDWKAFLHDHLESLSPTPRLAGIERSGWKLVRAYRQRHRGSRQVRPRRRTGGAKAAPGAFTAPANPSANISQRPLARMPAKAWKTAL